MNFSPHASRPHGSLSLASDQERFAGELFDRLWATYRSRVQYVGDYEDLLTSAGAQFVNDHIALRTFASQQPQTGISSISRPLEALGYRPAGVYHFEDKHLNAVHYQHRNAALPKIFISELKIWELSLASRQLIHGVLGSHRPPLAEDILHELTGLPEQVARREALMGQMVAQFHELPWDVPERSDVERLNAESQYAAWVLVHGYNVNHFTALVNSHQVPSLDDLEKTVGALRARGVPMKADIEGVAGSKLRQTATEAVHIDVNVREGGRLTVCPWTYAYFELAERGIVEDPETGEHVRFEGFLGPQATQLFEMTRVKPRH